MAGKNRLWVNPIGFVVATLVYRLDNLFVSKLEGWTTNNLGIAFKVKHAPEEQVIKTDIRPKSWPSDSGIGCTFIPYGNGWKFHDGSISATHINIPGRTKGFHLSFEENNKGVIIPRDINTPESDFLSKILIDRGLTL